LPASALVGRRLEFAFRPAQDYSWGLIPLSPSRPRFPVERELRATLEAPKTFMTDAIAPRTGLMQSVWANPILLLVITTLVWSAHSIVGRLAVGQVGPMTLTCLRWAAALIPILIAARPALRQDWPVLRKRWVYLAVMGAAGYTAFNALFYVAAHHTSALNLSIIQGAVPALVLIGARVFLGIRFSALQALGALITMIGVAVIAAQGDPARLAALAFNSGDVMMVAAAVLYAGYTIGLRQRPNISGVSMLAAMALAAFATSVPLMIWEIMSGGFVWRTWGALMTIAFVALGPAFVSQLTFMRGVELIGPGRAGVFVNLVPVFGAIMAVALLGEPFAAYHVLALLLVVGGIAIAQRSSSSPQTLKPNPRRST
jgi:drug/metabolite transporter (DMT)-like permease